MISRFGVMPNEAHAERRRRYPHFVLVNDVAKYPTTPPDVS
jgi:hypothetical protein